ncbi:hypothetical protein NDI37_24460 [Funiculus sociatus GB2-A5]|jgi:hypothetical protein|uniref:Uncharacterized protein n=1 Tax=Funiculus sociatus GB2-A5 TaxID=2933946 RepID=A0ABV0JWL5_9CYAN|nr:MULTISPECIES: hypothetical protein [unclassified Trichocoleus]MBD1906485.1 hypothetical protein [Trichocoleus sp. FACHB-832]MBD2065592.1 hypothetical protein [Trichocoleus sp. FACHB-6]
MQYPNCANLKLEQLKNKNTTELQSSLEEILAQLQKESLVTDYPDAEELGLKNISRNKRAVIERIIALSVAESNIKPYADQAKWECA